MVMCFDVEWYVNVDYVFKFGIDNEDFEVIENI